MMINIYSKESEEHEGVLDARFFTAPPFEHKAECSSLSTGRLGRLPVEIAHEVLMNLDQLALGMVRRLNTYYRILVEGLPAYRLLKEHAWEALCIMYLTETAACFSIRQLFDEFCHPRCRTCHDFGPFIFVLSCSRCCLNCLDRSREYQLAPVSDVMVKFALRRSSIAHFPTLYSLPGIYGKYSHRTHKKRVHLVSVHETEKVAHRIHGSRENIAQLVADNLAMKEDQYYAKVSKWEKDNSLRITDDMPHGSNLPRRPYAPRYRKFEPFPPPCLSTWQLLGSTSFPYWNTRDRSLELGMYCSACAYVWEEGLDGVLDDFLHDASDGLGGEVVEEENYYRSFLKEEIPNHFLKCKAVKRGFFRLEDRSYHPFPFGRGGSDFLVLPGGEAQPLGRKPRPSRRTSRKRKPMDSITQEPNPSAKKRKQKGKVREKSSGRGNGRKAKR